ncbi:MAG TPA: glycosyltransferase [Aquabacterium sp.]|nr:glycosyltransferase [Aquabacterium sp.]
MSVLLATLALNEMEWLPKLVEQHRSWPGLAAWVFVEAADAAYARANPDLVSNAGLSVDGTTEFLEQLAAENPLVKHIKYGTSHGFDGAPEKGKCGARQAYLDVAEQVQPKYVVSIDADEFYTHADQRRLVEVMDAHPDHDAFIFNRREIWRPPLCASMALMSYEVIGGFWGIPCCHWWRWRAGMNHRACHNTPSDAEGTPLNERLLDTREQQAAGIDMPEMIHFGFAATARFRLAKNAYYAQRGEVRDPKRRWYVESRGAWARWHAGKKLPRNAEVVPYAGPVPECFADQIPVKEQP